MRQKSSSRLIVGGIFAVLLAGAALWRARSSPQPPRPAEQEPQPAAAPATEPPPAEPPAAPRRARPDGGLSRADFAALDEARLMARLREVAPRDPALAVTLAREGNRRFPGSADAPERTSILIHALAALGRSSEARGEAEQMVNGTPDSDWVREIERFTGAHRHRSVRLNDAGVLEFH